MPISPVQSIRVAANLAERFGVLLSLGPTTVAEFELRIGEAQQMYPEIWRHLDDARTALAEAGRDVSSYDHLRKDELAHLGVDNIESTTSIDYAGLIAGRLGTVQFKTASFNEAGYRRALAACRALMAVMPEIDWKAVEHEEGREMRAAGSLHDAKWKHTGKAIIIGAALVGFGIIFARVLESGETPPPAPKPDPQADRQQLVRIDELRDTYALTCDRAVRNQLAHALRETSQAAEAQQIETAPCTPKRTPCDAVKAAIADRLATQLELVKDNTWAMTCQGVLIRGARRELGLAVVVSAHDKQHTTRVLRGVTSPDGSRDLIEFVAAPGTRLAGIADLDRDSSEELVFVDTTSVTVSRITARGFEDVEGPALGCRAAANIEGNDRQQLVVTVPDGVTATDCLGPGRHSFDLTRDGLSETR